jgi:integral membrane sensor domain MASE1
MAAASLSALVAHGGLLFTALLAAGFSRFTLGLWPAIATATVLGLWAASPFSGDRNAST